MTIARRVSEVAPLPAVEFPARKPMQDRSRASFERMLAAAETLLIQRGSDDFTLIEVSQLGGVSIGSIYNLFKGKDMLIMAVQSRAMERLEADQALTIMRARSRSHTLPELVQTLVDDLAEFLKTNAPLMRPMMLRAAFDPAVQGRGAAAHHKMVESLVGELLGLRDSFRHSDPERAARSVVRIAYATFARELGFGMSEEPISDAVWSELKEDVGQMAVAFLMSEQP